MFGNKRREVRSKRKKQQDKRIYILYLVLAVLVVLYILHNSELVGVLVFGIMLIILAAEFRSNVSSEGLTKTIYEVVIAIGAAALFLWVLPSILLHTSAPIDVIGSCSMLPVMHRGDLVVLSGITNMSQFLKSHSIPIVNLSSGAFTAMANDIGTEYLWPLPYLSNNRSAIQISGIINGTSGYNIGMYNISCISKWGYRGLAYNFYRCYVNQTNQSNLIKYNYSFLKVMMGKNTDYIAQISGIQIANTAIIENYSNPVIVYKPKPTDSFALSGDIIHRLYAAMKVNNKYYLLTKGDNNPILDIEAFNSPINSTNVVGYVIADIPYIGYPSLLIKLQSGVPLGCNQTIIRNVH